MSIERATPVFTEHPVFEPPGPDEPLWRYMDFPRFVAILERRALFFSSLTAFPDHFEGALTPELIADLQAGSSSGVQDWRNAIQTTYLSCWNEDRHENVALWSMYTSPSGGVAIKSSLASIINSLDSDTSGRDPADQLYAGRVRYVDYRDASIPSSNAFFPIIHKRLAYQFEHEVRLALWTRRLYDAGAAINPSDPMAEAVRIAPPGYDVAIDPNVLIRSVVVAPEAPDWLLELVVAMSRRYGVDAAVDRSDLDAEPP